MTRTKRSTTFLLAALALLLFAYLGSYLSLSMQGSYEPAAWGLDGVKWYSWAPRGFVKDIKWRDDYRLFYMPLYSLDIHFWHTFDDVDSGRYPVNWVN